MITGKTLIDLGYKPGPWFKEAIDRANDLELNGGELTTFLKVVCPPPPVKPFSKPVDYLLNIETETPEEEENVRAVVEAMDTIMRVPTVVAGAVMPDACPVGGDHIPVGAVVAAKKAIHPSWHSADMCCSVFLTDFGNVEPKEVLDAAQSITHFGGGGRKGLTDFRGSLIDNKTLYEGILTNYFTKDYIEKACRHLGTQGDGNHFLFVGKAESTGNTVMVTHHGSRGFGSSVYKKGMSEAEKFRRRLSPETGKSNAWIPSDDYLGELYWEAIQLIREWTKLNHSVIHNKTLNKVGVSGNGSFWNEHNSVFKDGDLFYHAKGVTPLDDKFVPDSFIGLRLIPLNMGQPILVVRGETTERNLGFAPHGAGRNVSRSAHRKSKGKASIDKIFMEETKGLDVRFFSGNIDITELPSAYKNAESVQSQMERFGLGEVVDRILPYGCIMAGDWKKDLRF